MKNIFISTALFLGALVQAQALADDCSNRLIGKYDCLSEGITDTHDHLELTRVSPSIIERLIVNDIDKEGEVLGDSFRNRASFSSLRDHFYRYTLSCNGPNLEYRQSALLQAKVVNVEIYAPSSDGLIMRSRVDTPAGAGSDIETRVCHRVE